MTQPAANVAIIPETLRKVITGFFWLLLAVAIILSLSIVILDQHLFLTISNDLQLVTAVAGALVFMYAYYRTGRPRALFYAAAAFGIWAAANLAWYVYLTIGQRAAAFPSMIDMGFLAFELVLASAYRLALPRKSIPGRISLSLLVIFLVAPLALLATKGITAQTMMTFLYFFFAAALIIIGINHSLQNHLTLFAGTLLYCIAFTIYPIRETLFLSVPYLNVLGALVIASFSLIVIGFLPVGVPAPTASFPSG
jgi:hypothetical protein